jgi:hypothetical protein
MLFTVGRTPLTGDQLVARLLSTQSKHTETSKPRVEFEATTTTVRATLKCQLRGSQAQACTAASQGRQAVETTREYTRLPSRLAKCLQRSEISGPASFGETILRWPTAGWSHSICRALQMNRHVVINRTCSSPVQILSPCQCMRRFCS